MKRTLILFATCCLLLPLSAQVITDETRQSIREGNDLYEAGKYTEAEVSYRKAGEGEVGKWKSAFNLGNSLYQQQRYEDAAMQFQRAATLSDNQALQAEAYHNMGNAHLKHAQSVQAKEDPSGALRKGIDAYKQALRRNPQDEETRYNLAYALRQLQQEQQQNQQNQDQDQDQEDQDQDQNEDQQNQDQQQNNDQNQDQDGQKQQQDQQTEEQEQQQAQEREMSKEEIEQMLEALRYQEQKLREDMQRQQSKAKQRKVEKDW